MAVRDEKGRWVKGHPQVAGSKPFLRGNIPWNKGKTMSEAFCRKDSEAHKGIQSGKNNPMYGRAPWIKGKTKETCEKVRLMAQKTSEALMGHENFFVTGHSERNRWKISEGLKGHDVSEDTKRKLSERATKRWEDPKVRERYMKSLDLRRDYSGENNPFYGKKHSEETLRKILKAVNAKPNKKEQFLTDLIEEYDLPFKYVGDGQFILGGKCPDFLNNNGKKQLIELYGDWWHKDDNPQERIDFFKKFGFDTLVIWEHELEKPLQVVLRIESFVEIS